MSTLRTERPRILGEQLRSARESLALAIEEVCTDVGVNAVQLNDWESNRADPSVEELWKLGDFYGRSTDYFLHRTPPRPPSVNFRLVKHRSFTELPLPARRVLVEFEELCRTAKHLEELAGIRRPIQVQRQLRQDDPGALAESERQQLNLDSRPIKNLRDLLAGAGVLIFELPFAEGEEVSGFSWWHDTFGPCVLVNAREPAVRRTFTLAHEFAHLIHSEAPTICDLALEMAEARFAEERFAGRFAAAFLMPAADVERAFGDRALSSKTLELPQVKSLARRYGVSAEAMARRLGELRLLPQSTVRGLLELLAKEKSRPFVRAPSGPRWRRRLGKRYVNSALEAYDKGHISLAKLAQYLHTDIRDVKQELRERTSATPTKGNG